MEGTDRLVALLADQTVSRYIHGKLVIRLVTLLGLRWSSSVHRQQCAPIVQRIVVENKLGGIDTDAKYISAKATGLKGDFHMLQQLQFAHNKTAKNHRDKLRNIVAALFDESFDDPILDAIKLDLFGVENGGRIVPRDHPTLQKMRALPPTIRSGMPDARALRRRAHARRARSPPASTCAGALSAGAHLRALAPTRPRAPSSNPGRARALRRRAHARRARSPPARTYAAALSAGAHLRALAPTHPRAPSSSPGRARAPPRDPHARALSRARAQPHIDPTRPWGLPPPVHPDSGPTVTQDFTTKPSTYSNIYVMHTSVISRVYFP